MSSEEENPAGIEATTTSSSVGAKRRLLAITTDVLEGPTTVAGLGADEGDGIELRIVVPAVEATPFRHTLGDVDEPRQEAEDRVTAILGSLRRSGIEATAEVGDPDPVQAAQDALLKAPADEVLIFEHQSSEARWFEADLFERAKAEIEPPLRLLDPRSGAGGCPASSGGRDGAAGNDQPRRG